MIDHITLWVSDLEKSKNFYEKVLAPLGYRLLQENHDPPTAGFGIEDELGKRDFWIKKHPSGDFGHGTSCIAFKASDKSQVDEFYRIGLELGAKDNGAPGYHTEYHSGYYAAFMFDPNGHNVEAVFDDI